MSVRETYGVVQQLHCILASVTIDFSIPFAGSVSRHNSSISSTVLVSWLPYKVTCSNFDLRPACSFANEFVGNLPSNLLLCNITSLILGAFRFGGMVPVNWFPSRCRRCHSKLPNESGICPSKSLFSTRSVCKFGSVKSTVAGIDQVQKLYAKSMYIKSSNSHINGGISPLKRLNETEKVSNSLRLSNELGIVPVSKLSENVISHKLDIIDISGGRVPRICCQ